MKKIDLSVFDEDIPEHHIMKLLFVCGIFFGFRGNEEHTFLQVRHFIKGEYPKGHTFKGKTWYGIDCITDKTHKLSKNTPYVRSIKDTMMRLPLICDKPKSTDGAGVIKRFLNKLSPGQIRIYCKIVPEKNRKLGDSRLFYSSSPMGKDTINKLFKKGAEMMGIDPRTFMPHSRGICLLISCQTIHV